MKKLSMKNLEQVAFYMTAVDREMANARMALKGRRRAALIESLHWAREELLGALIAASGTTTTRVPGSR